MGNWFQVRPGAVQAPVQQGAVTATGTATIERGAATAVIERGAATATIQERAAVIERGAATADVSVTLQADAFCNAAVCIVALALYALRDVLIGSHAPAWLAYIPPASSLLPLLATAATYRRLEITHGELQATNTIMGQRMNQLQLANGDLHAETAALAAGIPQGVVFAWKPCSLQYENGKLKAPSGYAVCDGTNGTPDLAGRFILGASAEYNPDKFKLHESGGTENHRHDVKTRIVLHDPWVSGWESHRHCMQNIGEDAVQLNTIRNKVFAADCNAVEHMPPFHTLIYIMKL